MQALPNYKTLIRQVYVLLAILEEKKGSRRLITMLFSRTFSEEICYISISAGPGGQILGGVVEGPLIRVRSYGVSIPDINSTNARKVGKRKVRRRFSIWIWLSFGLFSVAGCVFIFLQHNFQDHDREHTEQPVLVRADTDNGRIRFAITGTTVEVEAAEIKQDAAKLTTMDAFRHE
uniref:Probable galacturonosyltransferase 11 n=1 Tax=Tanacetum cinerariifolium TaxID=118510 RepID=A0A6L2NKY3_TANCI|nr:probable galacturonosyltransferase 11 [Tanacetum cinerariifolium]